MRLLSKELPSTHDLVLFGDNHRGNPLEHTDGLNECIKYISKKGRYAAFMGDAIEAIMIDDKRYDPLTFATPPLQQMSEFVADMWPIRKKLLVMLQGNHERKLSKFGDLSEEMAKRLGVDYGTYSSIISIRDKQGEMYKIFLSHGFGSINSNLDDPADRLHTMKRALRRKLMRKSGDCLISAIGHTHKLIIVKPTDELYLTSSDKSIKQHYVRPSPKQNWIPPQQRWYVNTGSFLKLYGDNVSGYAEVAGYNPMEMGFAVIKVRDREVIDIEKVIV